ncbi:hypothetical protein [Thalassovita mediterranea]|uniref:Tripartite tricarboxylate transporter TctB family protein n=1 Tax=Thalassovita mediterranea TaxID=340021 RepID=A0A0P1H3A3_9RHOB|nr:hypothetical protein [Thalassovita mediterranea]MCG7573204.1 hypothetical protein [Phaeobacter sp. CNT1-3]CUH84132.1 hypothetical protein TM5383_01337 [Thalassovita mediterranea]SIS27676.1 hypothetical protein SAMN05421685_101176 [Thalassovita mediterranea]
MTKWLNGEVLFGAFMIALFGAGAYDLLTPYGWQGALQDNGIMFALIIVAISVALLVVVSVTSHKRESGDQAFMGRRGVVIALVGLAYPVLFWAVEYLIATVAVGYIALALFTENFGRKPLMIATCFAVGSYLLFFFLLGITEQDGALLSTGLNNVLPTWRRDFFNAF